jgi:uncharacterized membrane protein
VNLHNTFNSMNSAQRAGAFVAALLVMLAIVLHGPWDGYSTTRYVEALPQYGISGTFIELSFLDWHTNNPVISWFGSILHTLVSVVVISLAFVLWYYLFRSNEPAPINRHIHDERA